MPKVGKQKFPYTEKGKKAAAAALAAAKKDKRRKSASGTRMLEGAARAQSKKNASKGVGRKPATKPAPGVRRRGVKK